MFKKYPMVYHYLIVGKQGTYKDITSVKFCYDGFINKNKEIFANQELRFPFIRIDSLKQIHELKGNNWNPSYFYYHDIASLFHSRDFSIKGLKSDARRHMVANMRKRGISILGTLHREEEVDIEIRRLMDWIIYPSVKNIGNKENMEDDIVTLKWYSKPEMKENGDKPNIITFYTHPERYAILYNTLEESVSLK